MKARVVLEDVSIFDARNKQVTPHQDIVIEDRKFAEISDTGSLQQSNADKRIDGVGLTAIPGLINLHVHLCMDALANPYASLCSATEGRILLWIVENACKTLSGGITTIRDLGGPGQFIFDVRAAIEEGSIVGPRIIAAGNLITRTGGHGRRLGIEADGESGVRHAVRMQLSHGADALKIMATGGVITPGTSPHLAAYSLQELKAAVDEARRENVPIAAHAQGRPGIENCVNAGVDTIEHCTFIDEAIARQMAEKGIAWIPTLSPHRFAAKMREAGNLPPFDQALPLRATREDARQGKYISPDALDRFQRFCMTEGLRIGIGTDAGVNFTPHDDLVTEMEMFVEYGFTPARVLSIATLGNAEILNLGSQIGSIEPGKLADLVLVKGNPLENLGVLRQVVYVIKDGLGVVDRLAPNL